MRRWAMIAVVAWGLSAWGCTALTQFDGFETADDGGNIDGATGDAGVRDGDVRDAGDRDGGGDGCTPSCGGSGTCVAGTCMCGSGAACTGVDMCCSGACVDTTDEVTRCGACDNICPTAGRATTTCVASTCGLTCEAGFGDCDANPDCEADFGSPATCGACGNPCASGEVCNAGTCSASCSAGLMNCSGSCVDIASHVLHCGGCGAACDTVANANASCSGSTCDWGCTGGFEDCNMDLGAVGSNGCEEIPATFFLDGDMDGAGGPMSMLFCAASVLPNYVTTSTDCDDTDINRFPGAAESCDGADNDCDPRIDEDTGFGDACFCEAGAAAGSQVCNGTGGVMCNYPVEVCNGRDDDCVGGIDNDAGFECAFESTNTCTHVGAVCSIGGTTTCDATCRNGPCEPPAELCNRLDDDCDGFIDEGVFSSLTPQTVGSFNAPISAAAIDWGRTLSRGAVVWTFRDTSGSYPIRFRGIDATGAAIGASVIVTTRSSEPSGLDLAWDGGAWVVLFVDPGTTELRYARVDSTGVVLTPDQRFPGFRTDSVQLAATAEGRDGAAVVWDGGGNLRARVMSLGTTIGMEHQLGAGVTPTSVVIAPGLIDRYAVVSNSGIDRSDLFEFFRDLLTLSIGFLSDGTVTENVAGLAYDDTSNRHYLVYRNGTAAEQTWFEIAGTATTEGPRTSVGSAGSVLDIAYAGNNTALTVGAGALPFRTRTSDGELYSEMIPALAETALGVVGVPTTADFLVVQAVAATGVIQTQRVGCAP